MRLSLVLATAVLAVTGGVAVGADDLKVALIYGKTGPLEAYAKQTETGLRMGFEYATKGSMTVDGHKIVIITKDDQGKPWKSADHFKKLVVVYFYPGDFTPGCVAHANAYGHAMNSLVEVRPS